MPSEIYQEYHELFGHHKVLSVQVSEWFAKATKSIGEAKCSADHAKALLGILAVSLRAYQAIAVLCEAGWASESLPLVRKLFEQYCIVKYIHIDPGKRAPLYDLLPDIASFLQSEKLWKLRGERQNELHYRPGSADDYSRSVDALIGDVGKCLSKAKGKITDLSTALKVFNIRGMLQEIDDNPAKSGVKGKLIPIYDGEFGPLSEFVHGKGANIAGVVIETKTRTVFDLRPSGALVPAALVMATKYFVWLLHDIATCFDGGLGLDLYGKVVKDAQAKNDSYARRYQIRHDLSA